MLFYFYIWFIWHVDPIRNLVINPACHFSTSWLQTSWLQTKFAISQPGYRPCTVLRSTAQALHVFAHHVFVQCRQVTGLKPCSLKYDIVPLLFLWCSVVIIMITTISVGNVVSNRNNEIKNIKHIKQITKNLKNYNTLQKTTRSLNKLHST